MLRRRVIRAGIVLGFVIFLFPLAAYAASGDVWLEPSSVEAGLNSAFTVEAYADTGAEKLGTYQFSITFDPSLVAVDTSQGTNGVEAGSNGFIAAVNTDNNGGKVIVNGFDLNGKGPGISLQILKVYFNALRQGQGEIDIEIKNLTNERGKVIGVPSAEDATVEIW